MTQRIVVDIISVRKGKTQNWLEFTAYVGALDRNRKYQIEFCGTELHPSFYLSETQLEALRDMLIQDFGFGPYKIDVAQAKVKELKGYVLEY